ncbi:uncharacterized protein LOC122508064 [Leptopilina heterotoma]|uniref:uncharacterized protein LOC122508064 n=1 Tax=Leptopilina heterotoma TaxID=63436 RepID=UPI001CA914A5|nr:uncharacterized protein LOC122508064 [Leptopilina heterotoma]
MSRRSNRLVRTRSSGVADFCMLPYAYRDRSRVPAANRPDLFAIFNRLDQIFYNGRLRSAGFTFSYSYGRNNCGLATFGSRVVTISIPLHCSHDDILDEDAIIRTLLHEVIHIYIFQHFRNDVDNFEPHGPTFMREMRRINRVGRVHGLQTSVGQDVDNIIFERNHPYRWLCQTCGFVARFSINQPPGFLRGRHPWPVKNCEDLPILVYPHGPPWDTGPRYARPTSVTKMFWSPTDSARPVRTIADPRFGPGPFQSLTAMQAATRVETATHTSRRMRVGDPDGAKAPNRPPSPKNSSSLKRCRLLTTATTSPTQ